MINKRIIEQMYLRDRKSMQDVAKILGCSLHKVKYWTEKHDIKIRSISDALYLKHNPNGDPFCFMAPKNMESAKLFGLGLGLYWGEGTKADKTSVRIGNTDPALIDKFMEFLTKIFKIDRNKFRFGLQLFTDISENEAMDFWTKKLKIKKVQFYKTVITPSDSIGTYRKKSRYGVLTLYCHNKKLRDLLVGMLPL